MLMRKNTAKTKFKGCGGCLPIFVSFQHISIAKFTTKIHSSAKLQIPTCTWLENSQKAQILKIQMPMMYCNWIQSLQQTL